MEILRITMIILIGLMMASYLYSVIAGLRHRLAGTKKEETREFSKNCLYLVILIIVFLERINLLHY